MRAPRLFVTIALLALLAAPSAAAGAIEGRLEAASARLGGTIDVEAEGLAFRSAAVTPPSLDIEFESVRIHRVGLSTATVDALGGAKHQTGTIDETAEHASARIALAPGAGAQVSALAATAASQLTISDPHLAPIAGVMLAAMNPTAGCVAGTPCLDARGVYQFTSATEAVGSVAGEVTLLLYGPTLKVTTQGAEHAYASGARQTGGQAPFTTAEEAWVIVTGVATRGRVASAEGEWYAAPTAVRAQSVTLEDSVGALSVGLSSYRAQHERVAAEGDIILALDPVAPSARTGGDRADESKPAYAPYFSMTISGDVQVINLRARPVFVDSTPASIGLAAAMLAVAGAAAYYWPHLSLAGASLYTRLRQPQILDNEVRNSIFEIIRANPGISARAVHRQSDQSWGTVVYHLRQLERHQLVVSRSVGRTRNYYENHGKYRGMEVQLACLQSPRARILARLVLNEPGIAQEELVAGSGYPQPTTSYYVRKLKGANLIEERREGRYARYHPVGDLARFLQLAEHSLTPTIGLSSSGVEG